MTVKELRELLKDHDENRIVVMSKDAEGNDFSPLYDARTAAYRAETTWSGEIGLEPSDLDAEARAQGYSEDDVKHDGVPALVLWPTN